MITWYSILLVIIAVLLIVIVVRLSEISTRMQIIESVSAQVTTHHHDIYDRLDNYCTHSELRAVLRASPQFTP